MKILFVKLFSAFVKYPKMCCTCTVCIALLSRLCASLFGSGWHLLCTSQTLDPAKESETITLPPPRLTVGVTLRAAIPSPTRFHIQFLLCSSFCNLNMFLGSFTTYFSNFSSYSVYLDCLNVNIQTCILKHHSNMIILEKLKIDYCTADVVYWDKQSTSLYIYIYIYTMCSSARGITIHDLSRFFVMLVFLFCKLFEQYSQTNLPIIKTKPLKITTYKKYGRYLGQSGWRYKSLSLFYLCY